MVRGWRRTAVLACWVISWVIPTATRGLEQDEIPLAKVPDVVRQAASKAVPDARWSKAFRSTEDDETVYELIGEDSKDRQVEVELTPAGTVLEIERGVPLADVPPLILGVLKARGVKPTRARAVTQKGKVVAYALDGRNAKDQVVKARVSTDGKAVEVEVDSH